MMTTDLSCVISGAETTAQMIKPAQKLHRISEDSPDAVYTTTAQTIKPAHKMDRILFAGGQSEQ